MNTLGALVSMIPGTMWVGLVLGGVGGYYVGQWRTEVGIAKHGMARTWKGRSGWREKND